MQNFDRKAHWQNIYQQKEATEVSWFQAVPIISLELITRCGIEYSDPIIDVGGGASVLVDHLLGQGHTDITVLDISKAALTTSKKRLGHKASAVHWITSDITTFSAETSFSVWHDRAVFHFLTDTEDRQSYVRALKASLSIGGHLILASFAIGGPEKCSGLPIVQYNAQKLMAELGQGFKLVEERTEKHITPTQRMQAFSYFHLVRVNENKV